MSTTMARFWSKVDIAAPDACWLWQAYRHKKGYGWTRVNGRSCFAHRAAAFFSGLLEQTTSELQVLHKCDTPACCNPAHLFTGTNADNVADRVAKGRSAGRPQYGEANGAAKLTDAQILEIRTLYAAGRHSQTALAQLFGAQQPTISRIISGKRRGNTYAQ